MTYQEARSYLKQVSRTGSVLGLANIRNLMEELGNVQEQLPIVHIAGTNGKGSVGAFLGAILQEAGYLVGRYVSPAVFSPLEVWQINGENICEEAYANLVEKVKKACEKIAQKGMEHPTVFEVETAMAFCYFAEKKCDYVLLEVGMGGRKDATNLIKKPLCSVITSISKDHMQFLGGTLAEIAYAKAGIIKENCPVLTVSQPKEAESVLQEEARLKSAPYFCADEKKAVVLEQSEREVVFSYREFEKIRIRLTGSYQVKNAVLALEAARLLLAKSGKLPEKNACMPKGLEQARWAGRFECISQKPLFYIDGAHNEEAAFFLRETLENCFTNKRILYIIGVLADKEHDKMLRIMLPLADRVYTVTPPNARGLGAQELAEEAKRYHNFVQAEETIADAVKEAYADWREGDVIVAFGSLSYLKELKDAALAYTK